MTAAIASFGTAIGAVLSQTSIVKNKINDISGQIHSKIDGIIDKARQMPTNIINTFNTMVDKELRNVVAGELRKPLPAGTPGAYVWNRTSTGTSAATNTATKTQTATNTATRTQTGTFTIGNV